MGPTTCLLTSNLRAALLPLHLVPPSEVVPPPEPRPARAAPRSSAWRRGLVGLFAYGGSAVALATVIVGTIWCVGAGVPPTANAGPDQPTGSAERAPQ